MECLALAASCDGHGDSVKLARRLYDFAIGEAEKTPRERILQALDDAADETKAALHKARNKLSLAEGIEAASRRQGEAA